MNWWLRGVGVFVLLVSFGCDEGNEQTSDCRNIGCVGDFICQLNADNAYECLPTPQGGTAGGGGNEGGSAGSPITDADTAGDDGAVDAGGNEAGSAGASGSEGGAAGDAGNEAGDVGETPDGLAEMLDFVPMAGGTYQMGFEDAPEERVHLVTVPDFEIMRTEVTVAQFKVCVDAGVCQAPTQNGTYVQNLETHPVNFVTWDDAKLFADFVGARLPSEAEWEYAARGGGQNITFAWGNEEPDCDRANYAYDGAFDSCVGTTTPVCTYPTGNTAQGLCDMTGNVHEWLEDDYHNNYIGMPTDGSARIDEPRATIRSTRGGGYGSSRNNSRVAKRNGTARLLPNGGRGFRLARDAR